jgi:hypothetical protein
VRWRLYDLNATPEGTRVANTVELELRVLAACSGASLCRGSETPWPPTSGKLKELLEG